MFKVGQKVEIIDNSLYKIIDPDFAIGQIGTITSLKEENNTAHVDTSGGELKIHEIKGPKLFHFAFPQSCLKPAKVN